MKKTFIAVIIGLIVLLALLAFASAQRSLDSRISSLLTSSPGIEFAYSGRSGNILTGYSIGNVIISRADSPDGIPGASFSTPAIKIGLKNFPFALKSISWNDGTLTINPGTDRESAIPVGRGLLIPDASGSALTGSAIPMGDPAWGGSMDLTVNRDGAGFSGSIIFESLPATELAMFGFDPALLSSVGNARMGIEINGTPESTDVTGNLSASLQPDSNEPGTVTVPSINVLFGLEPLQISGISWNAGTYTTAHPDGKLEILNFGDGKLVPGGRNLLKLESMIPIGPEVWNGRMDLTIGARLENIDARIYVDNLPVDMLDLFTAVPDGFPSVDTVALNLVTINTPEGIRTHGNATDPLTNRSFAF